MDEKKMLDLLRKNAETLTPPESLTPEAIEKMLRENSPRKHDAERKKKKRYLAFTRYGGMAAILVLGLTVLWQAERSSHLQEPVQRTENASDLASVSPETGNMDDSDSFRYADNYLQIYDTLHDLFGAASAYTVDSRLRDAGNVTVDMEIASMDSVSIAESGSAFAGSGSLGFSQTNLQELGVDEGDIVKTDGEWIYILKEDLSVSVVRAKDGSLELVSTITPDSSGLSDVSRREMYLDGDTLSVIADGRQTMLEQDGDVYQTATKGMTVLSTWDISDRSHPALSGTLNQEGYYADSRKSGRFLYLFTSYTPTIADTYEASSIVPRINGAQIPADSFYLPKLPTNENYLVIASVDVLAPSTVLDQKVLVSGASDFYVSPNNIYITNQTHDGDSTITEITKFHYSDGQIAGAAAGSVKGYLNNSFSLNEYDGMLRVVSTYYDESWEEWNALYVLDESLQQLSVIDQLAKGETIRSARFFGDMGYFVTFRQTDPLFSVDLSVPTSPKILGEMKVSGFSSYLHFYGENRLLGIGYEADEATGSITGLKLSMFDISDPANVAELHRLVIPGITWCPAIENYKTILADPVKNVIGFYCDKRYFVYSYDETSGFRRELLSDFYSDDFSPSATDYTGADADAAYSAAADADYDNVRGLYINDTFYLAGNGFVISYDMSQDFKKQKLLLLD